MGVHDSLGRRPATSVPVGEPSSPISKCRAGGSYGLLMTGLASRSASATAPNTTTTTLLQRLVMVTGPIQQPFRLDNDKLRLSLLKLPSTSPALRMFLRASRISLRPLVPS